MKIKRLELIKNLILLDETDQIPKQIIKLNVFKDDSQISEIIKFLQINKFGDAVKLIENYIISQNAIVKDNSEVIALKIELKVLENEIFKLSNEKIELQKEITDFEIRYYQELGDLIKNILHLKANIAKFSKNEKDYQETFQDYQQFKNESKGYEDKKIIKLNKDDKEKLKKLYRKASLKCHPDKVPENQKEQANKIFTQLNNAYQENDLEKVIEILNNLEKGLIFKDFSDIVNEAEKLRSKIQQLRKNIETLKKEIKETKQNEFYITLYKIDDLDYYFDSMKKSLKEELEALER